MRISSYFEQAAIQEHDRANSVQWPPLPFCHSRHRPAGDPADAVRLATSELEPDEIAGSVDEYPRPQDSGAVISVPPEKRRQHDR